MSPSDMDASDQRELALQAGLALIDAMDELFIVADEAGHLLLLNPAARRLLGTVHESPSHLNYADLMPAWAHTILLQTALPLVIAEGKWIGEIALLGADGAEVPVRLQMVARQSHPDSPPIHLLLAHNLSGEQRREHALNRARQDAENSNHVRGQFLSNIASQLKAPLATLGESLEQIDHSNALPAVQQTHLKLAQDYTRKMRRFIDDVLTYIQLERL